MVQIPSIALHKSYPFYQAKKIDSLIINYYFRGHQITKPNNAFVLIMGNPSKLHGIKLVILPTQKNGSHFMGKPLVFFSFMGSTTKNQTGPYFSTHKKPTGTTLLLVVFLGTPIYRRHEFRPVGRGRVPTSAAEDPEAFRIQLRLPLLQQVGVGRWLGWLVNLLMGWWRKTGWYFFLGNLDIDDTSIFRSDVVCI